MTDSSRSMSFWDHIGELRARLVRSVLALVAGFVLCWIWRERIFALVNEPIRAALARHDIYRLVAIDAAEAILVYLKLSMAGALILAAPVILAQIWGFVKPGLYPHERAPVRRVVILSLLMFFIGVLFCYRLVLPLVIDFLTTFTVGGEGIDLQLTMQSAFSTALLLMLMFGLIFQLPLVMVLLTATRILTWRHYRRFARYFVVAAFIIAAILTPPDVVSQVLMAIPLLFLYAVGLGLSFLLEAGRGRVTEGDPAEPPRAPRVDGMLILGVLVLGGIIALLAWPAGPGPADLLPPDPDRALSWDRTRLPGTPGGLEDLPEWSRLHADPADAERLLLAHYRDRGDLLLLEGPPARGCGGEGFPGTWDGGGPCYRAGDVVALGAPALLAAVRHLHEQGGVGPVPLFPSGRDPPLALFLRTGGPGQPEGVEAGLGEEGDVTVVLSMRDGGEARSLVWALEASAAEEAAAPGGDPLREVAELLAILARDAEPAVAARATRVAERLRRDPGATPGGGPLVARLGRILGTPETVEADGRQVLLGYGPGGEALPGLIALWRAP